MLPVNLYSAAFITPPTESNATPELLCGRQKSNIFQGAHHAPNFPRATDRLLRLHYVTDALSTYLHGDDTFTNANSLSKFLVSYRTLYFIVVFTRTRY
jgi:hypothetical protein